ncbi:hypothetical protein [Alicyclobacillus herbarius]|uniref:hypothetical protein n=1 Tax=Alicyclobacillus herbarius TaxID=122960 RepID=UPI0009D6F91C
MQMNSTVIGTQRGTLDFTIHLAAKRLMESQNAGGFWSDCFDTGAMPDAQTAICLYLLGVDDPEWTSSLLSRILSTQRQDGSWGVYPEDGGDLSTSVECYYALQLYGWWRNHTEEQRLAQEFILRRGGMKRCRNLTKTILAIGGEIPWSWLPSPRLYLLLFSDWFPISIWDVVTFTRLHIVPMLILSSFRYVAKGATTRVLDGLLTPRQRRFALSRNQADGGRQPSSTMLRRLSRCIHWMMDKREEDGTAAGYHSSTFLVIFALCALGMR